MARIVIRNALFHGRARMSSLIIPWCTYTTPELAHVGIVEDDANARGISIDTYRQNLAEQDRAVLGGETEGFVKIHVHRGTDRIVGATLVAPHAGDLISEICLAMTHRLGLRKLASTVHPYPTMADAVRRIGDQYNRTRLTPGLRSLLQRWFRWRR